MATALPAKPQQAAQSTRSPRSQLMVRMNSPHFFLYIFLLWHFLTCHIGIGPEVISAGIEVLETLAKTLDTFDLEFTHFDWSSDRYKKEGKYLPDDALEQVKKFNAIFFGAVGAPG
jgi:hypothetical protein